MGDDHEKVDDEAASSDPSWYGRCLSWVAEHRGRTGLLAGVATLAACLSAFTDVAGFLGFGSDPASRPGQKTTSLPPTAPRSTGAPSSGTPATASSWTQRLAPNGTYDVDAVGGKDAGDTRRNDLIYRPAGVLAPPDLSRAHLGRGRVRDKAGIDAVRCPGDGHYRERALTVADMPVGYVFCVQTSEGRHARINIVGVSGQAGPPTLRIRVWVREGARR